MTANSVVLTIYQVTGNKGWGGQQLWVPNIKLPNDVMYYDVIEEEQQNDKAITTPASNALLGEYFRNRLGLANGAYVTAADLRSYGRTDVTFIKIDEEHYYMDFSI